MPFSATALPAPVDNGSGTGVITLSETLPAGTIIVAWALSTNASLVTGPNDSQSNVYHTLLYSGLNFTGELPEYHLPQLIAWTRVDDPAWGPGGVLNPGDTITGFGAVNWRAVAFQGIPVDAQPTLLDTQGAAGYAADTPGITSTASDSPPVLIIGAVQGVSTDYPNVYDDGWTLYSPNPFPAVPAPPSVTVGGGYVAVADLTDSGIVNDQRFHVFYQPMAAQLVGFYGHLTGDDPYTVSPTITGLRTGFGTGSWSTFHEGHWLINWWGFEVIPESASGPWILSTRAGQCHIAYADEGNIIYQRTNFPETALEDAIGVTSGGEDASPRMVEIEPSLHSRIRLVFEREGSALKTDSDDNGDTWSTPVTVFAAGTHPDIAYDPRSQTILYATYNGGELIGRVQGPAESVPGAEFTFMDNSSTPLSADDASFHVTPAADNADSWLLVLQSGGEIKRYQSTDDAETWEELP